MKFYLIGDYPLLGSKSMEKYPVLIKNIFKNKINFQILKPKIFFNKINFKCLFLRKWLGYLDNYILFGIFLFFKIKKDDLVHICNQSNSLLFPFLRSKKIILTCHDLVNIELLHDKELKNFSNLSYSGKIYQYLILYFIKKFKTIICVSKNTKKILTKFLDVNDKNIFKIYNTLNDTFYKVSLKEKNFFLKKNNLSFSFFLHVGANVWYKNKINLIKIFFEIIKITRRKNFKLVLISNSFSNDLKSLIKELNLEKKIFLFKNVKLKDLRCFYSSAEALILPSIREGFGWPIIEAQKCLCPVFTINKSPMNELGLDSVFYLDSKNPKKSALLIDRLLKKKKSLIKKGKKNVNRFNSNIFFKEMSIVYNRYL